MKSKLTSMSLVTMLVLAGCSDGGGSQPAQTGGHVGSGTGGESQTGGNSGGSSSKGGSGGTTSSGGSSATGGTSSSGGGGTGGISSTGGKTGTPDAGNGGAAGNGGTSSTGGEWATGGIGAGGLSAKGGATGSGGIVVGAGGVPGTGGVGPIGGTTAKGGADGGAAGASGTGGGTSVTISASGYPAAGASGQAAPTGAASKVTVVPWAGFKGAISFTFDDTNSSQISNYSALQALNDKGNNVRYTFFMQTGKTTELGNSVWPQAIKDGHEFGNHTKSHQSAASSSDLQAAEDTLKSTFKVTAVSVAAPNGDASYQTVVPSMKEFLTNRTAGNNGAISMTDDPTATDSSGAARQYRLPCVIPATGSSSATMQGQFMNDIKGGKWQIFLVHGFTGGSDSAYQPVPIAEFTSAVKAVKDLGNIWIDSVGTISAYWVGAFKFSKLTATSSGTDKTWTWKTSDFGSGFPTGKYLRVTTDGGTLKQGSTTLQWDDHGYYEVSLDAGTLTLSAQ